MGKAEEFLFMNGNQFGEEETEIELSLGLSLNGRFGVDPKRVNRLTRSSSIPDFINPIAAKDDNNSCSNNDDDSAFVVVPMACAGLLRACSLPTETEEEWRKRKELQTLRRMEAKRKRSEKQRNLKISRQRSSRVFAEENLVEEYDKRGDPFNGVKGTASIVQKAAVEGGFQPQPQPPPPPPPPTAAAAEAGVASQGSNASSQAIGSSGVSEFESQLSQGLNKCSEVISPSSIQSVTKSGQKLPPHPEAATTEKTGQFVGVSMENEPNKKPNAEKGVREVVRNVLEDMPCVSTKGDGPNGKRIEGFLYRYRKGEEVRIVCVCHGSFLSPAEFVKHAGGGDVANPLKHIVVNPSPLL